MSMAETHSFIHLRNHSAFSLSEGALRIEETVKLAQKHRMPALAITDTNNLFGALEFAEYAAKSGIQPIIGCQLSIAQSDKSGSGKPGFKEYDQLVLLVQNETGYRNLLWLVSESYQAVAKGDSPHLALSQVLERNEGLICLSGAISGAIARHFAENRADKAEELALNISRFFGNRFYIELQRHNLPQEDQVESSLIDLAYKHHLPLVATNECFFADESMYEAHDALLCIAEGKVVSDQTRRRLTEEHRFKSSAEMKQMFADLPEAIENTVAIAKRCSFLLKGRAPILPRFPTLNGETEEQALRKLAAEGLEARFKIMRQTEPAIKEEIYRSRLEFELDVIIKMGFAGYFLIVADFIQWSKRQDIPVGPGRGSGAGSVVAWALTITDLDPLRWGLLFERFLNPERVSMPDFDIDFCQERRDEVIHYVQSRFGYDQVAQIITFGKLQARAVLRDVGRVLAMAYGHVDKICKLVPNNPAAPVTLKEAIDGEPLLQAMRDEDPTVRQLMEMSLHLEGLYRHASTHAAGVVIGDRPLYELVPMYRDPRSDMPVTQFNMKYVEKAGLVKFDFLGLKTLTVLSKTLQILRGQNIVVDLNYLPLDDSKTYEMLGHGDTTGVFQLESAGMRETLRRLKPDRFEDIIAVVALYRPGPMDNIPSYIARKHGKEQPDYLHPSLEPILKETYGIAIYQEQVMQIAQVLSGYTLGSADLLRRAMGKKIKSEMDAQRESFIQGAKNNKVDADTAGFIFEQVEKFAGYGFNKSHAAAYALIAYQTAWLKANYPVAFMAALMTLDMGDTDKLASFKQELARIHIPLLPPDINKSEAEFAVEGDAIRYALAALKGVGHEAMKQLVAERNQKGIFKNLSDFMGRINPRAVNKRQLESLIAAGAFDSIHKNRAELNANAEKILRHAASERAEKESQQVNIFAHMGEGDSAFKLDTIPDWHPMEKLAMEFGAVGFYLSAHPLDSYKGLMRKLNVTAASDIATSVLESRRGGRLNLCGVMIAKKERKSQKGNKYAFASFSDQSGSFEVTLFSEILAASRELLDSNKPLLLSVEAQVEGDTYRLTAQSIKDLDVVARDHAGSMNIVIEQIEAASKLASILEASATARTEQAALTLTILTEEEEVEVALQGYKIPIGAAKARIAAIEGIVIEEL